MRGTRGIIAGAVLLGLASHAVDARAQSCQKDNDCPGDLICNGGQCQTMSGAVPPPAAAPAAAPGRVGLAAAPAAAPVAGRVPVSFTGAPVTVMDMASNQKCVAPCTLQLVPGNHSLVVDGFGTDIVVASPGGTFQVTGGDTGMIVGGAVATAFGITGIVVGGVFSIVGSSDSSEDTSYSSTDEESSDLSSVGKPLLLGGGALLAVGIVLLAGADKPAVTQTATNVRTSGIPMVGVAPTRGGALLGATMAF